MVTTPRKPTRDPKLAAVFEASLLASAYDTPPPVSALLYDRLATRDALPGPKFWSQ